jgi:LPS sulfotransferase NodH
VAFAAYIICGTPRSGSTLLCDLLKQTGVTGRPNSYYRLPSIPDFVQRFGIAPGEGLDFERRYLAAAIKAGTGDTGMFGLRVHALSLFDLLGRLAMLYPAEPNDRARIDAAFGTTLYIRLRRHDKVAQAISRLKAEQSGLWHRHADGGAREQIKPYEAPVYDAARLRALIDETMQHEAVFDAWTSGQDITPLDVSYEGLSADPGAMLARILAALGRDTALAARAEVKTAKLADATSLDWAARYSSESVR